MKTTIKDIGEIELLNRLKKFMHLGQIDDDVAEINSNKKKGWILHKKNQCIFSAVYGEVIFKLYDGTYDTEPVLTQ